jgi:HAD superfamily hydrolase (TIGR01509 family)
MTRPKAVFFDIGSTLWSSPAEDPGALANCYGRARQALIDAGLTGVPAMESLIDAVEGHFANWEDIWRADSSQVIQPPTYDYVARALAELGLVAEGSALTAFTDALLETSVYTAKTLEPEPGMKEALAGLWEQGVRLACVSNAFMGAAVLDQIMAERGLGNYLDFTVSSCELGYRKPHPAIYQAALDKAGIAGAEAVFVGDRLDADIEGPSKLGMRTVLTWQYRQEDPTTAPVKPDHVINHLSELVPYLTGLLKE